MEWWQVAIVVALGVLLALALAGFLLWRKASAETQRLGERVSKLPWASRLKLAWRLTRDDRVPMGVRVIPPLLVLYLAMPIDLVPDFIPVLGQLDDVLVVVVALGLMARFLPLPVIDGHIDALEAGGSD